MQIKKKCTVSVSDLLWIPVRRTEKERDNVDGTAYFLKDIRETCNRKINGSEVDTDALSGIKVIP